MTAIWNSPRLLIGLGLLGASSGVYWVLSDVGALDLLQHPDQVRDWIDGLGAIGPVAVIAAMTLAIVISPLPSAPIALAAGALYGHGWGTAYVIVGAESGALLAFSIARVLGQNTVNRWLGTHPTLSSLKSQNALMAMVFFTRMAPFLSFDIVSYAAGLSPLRAWRFAIATLFGIAPASFALTHFGHELGSGDMTRATITMFAMGVLTLSSIAVGWWWRRRRASDTAS